MTTFTLDTDNNITAFTPRAARRAGQLVAFATEKELTKLSADWPITRFVEVWNAFAGAPPFGDLKPVKKFTDRKTAVARIWKAIQALTPAPRATGGPRRAEEGQGDQGRHRQGRAPTTRDGSKKAIVLDLLKRAGRRHAQRHHVRDRLAGPQRPRLHLRQPRQEDGPHRRILQTPRWRARLPHRRSSTAPHTAAGLTRRRRFCSGSPPP